MEDAILPVRSLAAGNNKRCIFYVYVWAGAASLLVSSQLVEEMPRAADFMNTCKSIPTVRRVRKMGTLSQNVSESQLQSQIWQAQVLGTAVWRECCNGCQYEITVDNKISRV